MHTQHTPGSWKVDIYEETERLHTIWSEPISRGSLGTLVGRTCFAPASEANAHLMAAAPEMLSMLQYLAEQVEEAGWHRSELKAIQAVIDKAMGKTDSDLD